MPATGDPAANRSALNPRARADGHRARSSFDAALVGATRPCGVRASNDAPGAAASGGHRSARRTCRTWRSSSTRAEELLAGDGPRIAVATGRYIGEGFDDQRLDTLVLAMPIAWTGTMTQYAGRLHRHHDAKHELRILDYIDHDVPVLRRMFAKRRRAFSSLGYRPGARRSSSSSSPAWVWRGPHGR